MPSAKPFKYQRFPEAGTFGRLQAQLTDLGYVGETDVSDKVKPRQPGWTTIIVNRPESGLVGVTYKSSDGRVAYAPHMKDYDNGTVTIWHDNFDIVTTPASAHSTVARIGFVVGELLMDQALAENAAIGGAANDGTAMASTNG